MDTEKNRKNQANYRQSHRGEFHVLHTYLDTCPYMALKDLAAYYGETKRAVVERLLLEAREHLHSKQSPEIDILINNS